MKYFAISCEKNKNSIPIIKNWYGKIDKKDINLTRHILLDERQLFFIESYKNLVFTDVISSPFFLISEMFKEVLDMYDFDCPFKQIVLLDEKNKNVSLYYLPILKEIDCVSDKTEFEGQFKKLKKIVLNKNCIKDSDILFKILIDKKEYIIIHLDLIESILRRNAKGIKLEEVGLEEILWMSYKNN